MSNYKAMVAKIDRVVEIAGADNIHTAYVLGEQVVVSKSWGEGKLGLFFPADTKLSEGFCSNNNLFRDAEKNINKEKKGFFDDNQRVRCQPFLKVRSEGFFCEISSLSYLTSNLAQFKLGQMFDEVSGTSICEKYISPQTRKAMNNIQKKKTKVVETPMFHKHVDTEQFKYYVDKIEKGDLLHFHAKIHGTSARYSHSKVLKQPKTLFEKVKNLVGLFQKETWSYLVGTRNVVLHEDQYDKEGFHGSEQFRFDVLELLKPHLEKGMTIYGELAGFANEKPIMSPHKMTGIKDKKYNKKYGKEVTYSYGCREHEFRFHVYRITYVNEANVELDFTDAQIKAWCESRDILHPLEVHEPMLYDGDKDKLVSLVEELTERPDCLTEDYIDPSHISEGIVIRVDKGKQIPTFYKSKSYAFKVAEGILKESGDIDLEEAS